MDRQYTDKKYSSYLDVNNQIYFCGVPFRMDSYSGCTHECAYCYVKNAEDKAASRTTRGKTIALPEVSELQKQLSYAFDSNEDKLLINIEWLRRRVPIHWGGMSDPFQQCEKKYKVSLKWMESLSWYNYPVVISTKGVMLQQKEYLDLLKQGKYFVQISLINDNSDFINKLEPHAPSVKERLKLIETLVNNNIPVAVRIQPVIPNSLVEEDLPNYITRLGQLGVQHVLIEGYKKAINMPEVDEKIAEVCPETYRAYMGEDVKVSGFEALLPTWRKWKYAKIAQQAIHEAGMTYGAADNDLRDLGDTICCCGIDNTPGFENYWKYQASWFADIAKKKGIITLEDVQNTWKGVKHWAIHNHEIRIEYEKIYNVNAAAPWFAVEYYWERGGENSPECMFSMKKTQKDGKVAYRRINPIPILESQAHEQTYLF